MNGSPLSETEHFNGRDVYPCASYERAWERLDQYVREWWTRGGGRIPPDPPKDEGLNTTHYGLAVKYVIDVTRYVEVALHAGNPIAIEAASFEDAKDQAFDIFAGFNRDDIDWQWGEPDEYGNESFAFDIEDDDGNEVRFELDEKGRTASRSDL
jgi:hypothetical protein